MPRFRATRAIAGVAARRIWTSRSLAVTGAIPVLSSMRGRTRSDSSAVWMTVATGRVISRAGSGSRERVP